MVVLFSKDKDFANQCMKSIKLDCSLCFDSIDSILESVSLVETDIVLFDLNRADSDEIRRLNCRVIALASVPMYEEAVRLLKFGVKAYGNRRMTPKNLIQAIKTVNTGQVWLPPSILGNIITAIPHSQHNGSIKLSELSERELEVANLVGLGKSNKEIAEDMEITVRTVKAHLSSIFIKTNSRDRVELALKIKSS